MLFCKVPLFNKVELFVMFPLFVNNGVVPDSEMFSKLPLFINFADIDKILNKAKFFKVAPGLFSTIPLLIFLISPLFFTNEVFSINPLFSTCDIFSNVLLLYKFPTLLIMPVLIKILVLTITLSVFTLLRFPLFSKSPLLLIELLL